MKKSAVLWLAVSLAVNAVIVVALVMRPGAEAAPMAGASGAATSSAAVEAATAANAQAGGAGTAKTAAGGAATAVAGARAKSMWELVGSRDPKTLADNLRAMGFPPGSVRGAVYALLRDLQTADRTKAVDSINSTAYWKNDIPAGAQAAYSKEIARLWLERDKTMRSIFPEEQQAFVYKMQTRFGPITEATMEKISALEQDYSEMMTQARSQSRGIMQMPWAGEQITYLEKEKQKDIAALLSPTELETYQMRGSSTGQMLQRQLDGFEPSEQEYRDIYRLRAAADEASRAAGPLGGLTPEARKAATELETNLKTTLGEARFAEYVRGMDNTFQTALSVTRSLDLPVSKANEVYEMQRDLQKREAELRGGGAGLSAAERTAQLAAIASERNQKLAQILTPAGAEQYNKNNRNGIFFLGN